MVFAGKKFYVRRSWSDVRLRLDLPFESSDSEYTDRWGLLVSSGAGLHRLDEASMEFAALSNISPLYGVAAFPSGRLFVAKPRSVLELTPTATRSDSGPVANRLDIFPNPSSGRVTIRGTRPGSEYTIVDILGRTVYRFGGRQVHTIAAGALAPGLYFLIGGSNGPQGMFLIVG